ncbi:hypothetical protein GCM10020220_073860 [Nonomuraea rubra]
MANKSPDQDKDVRGVDEFAAGWVRRNPSHMLAPRECVHKLRIHSVGPLGGSVDGDPPPPCLKDAQT